MTKKNSSFLLWQFPPLFHCQKQGDACLPLGRWQSLFISLVLVLAFSFLFAPPALARDFQVKDTSGNTLFIIKGDVANVGIGTAGPASKLSVNGGISVGSYYATAAPSNGMIISGNVGIGKTNPGASLDVNGAAKVLSFTLPTGAGEGKVLASEADGTGYWKSLSEVSGVTGSGADNRVTIWTGTSTVSKDDSLVWDRTNHRLSIGTDSPSTYKLNVQGGDVNLSQNAEVGWQLTVGTKIVNNDGSAAAPAYSFNADNDSGLYRLGANKIGLITAGSATNGITIDSAGKVGIGTTNPNQQLELTQNLRIPNTTYANQYGIIYKGTTPFIHDFNYGNNGTVTTYGLNTFVGLNAGNLTMGSTATSASQASNNTAIGYQSFYFNTTGYRNSALGMQSLVFNTTGYQNSVLGWESLYYNTTGNYNSALGSQSLHSNTTGNSNSAFGLQSLYYNTTGSNNFALGAYADFYVPSVSFGASAVSGSGLEVGNYLYRVSFVLDGKETALSDWKGVTTTSGNQQVDLSGIPTYSGPKNCTARKIYRTKVNSSIYYYIDTLNDNTTTTYSDTTPDASLTQLPVDPSSSIMLGYNAKAFESNQMVIGSDDNFISQLYLGEGVYATSPHNITINATGGQGTNNPGASLILAGGKGTGTGAGGDIIFQSAPAGSSGSLANSLTELMRIKSTGNVGIGATSPTTAKLVINPGTQPSIDAGSQRIINVATPTAPSDAVTKDYVDSASVSHALTADYAANAGAADNATYANSSLRATYLGSSFNVTADAEGNLGIGTTSPTQKLDAVGNVNIRDAVSNWSGLTIKPNYPLVGSLTANYISTEKDGTGAHKPIIFRTNDANRLTIDTNGNVGIGTTSPLALLDVNNKLLVSNEQITINAPLNLNLPGDFSLSSDLQFTNPIASYIKSYAPLYIEAGDPNQNYDLILRSAGGGQVVVDDNLNVVGDMRIDGGLTVDSVTMNGNIDMGGDHDITGVNKLTVATIDPVYEIDGEKYASYVADYVGGVRTETSGTIQVKKEKSKGKNDDQNSKVYEYVIDFNDLEKKSDLWLFWETSNKEIDDLVVILTPGFEGKTWYEKKGNKLIIYANESGEVSYRLTAPRLDDKDWSNLVVSEN